MHEAGLLAAAVAEALAVGGPEGSTSPGASGARPVAFEVTVHDPIHISPESARMHAELALLARGLGDVEVTVISNPVVCLMCEVPNQVNSEHPFCADCGWPLPDKGGHQIAAVMRWA